MKSMLGVWLEEKRTQMGLTKGQISESIGIAIGQYSAYVNGKSTPRQITLERISQALSVPMEDLRQMMNTPVAASSSDSDTASSPNGANSLQPQLAAAQSKIIEGKLDIVIAMLTDISNRLSN